MRSCSLLLRLAAVLTFASCFCLTLRAQTIQIFGGYEFERPSAPIGRIVPGPVRTGQDVTLNGWEIQGQYKLLGPIGAVADFGGGYGNLRGGNTRLYTYLFGPSISLHTRVAPFAHVLVGAAHETQAQPNNPNFFSLGSSTSFATAVGGGIDAKLLPFVSVRLVQIDFMHTDIHNGGQNFLRVSAGFVVHF
jgi:hypothetical protein